MKYNHLKFIAYGEMTVKKRKRLVVFYINQSKNVSGVFTSTTQKGWRCFTSADQKISEF